MANVDALNLAELTDEADRLESQGGLNDFLENFVRMPDRDGYVTVRLLPPAKGKKFYCATRTHRLNTRNVHCPRILVNGRWVDADPKNPCCICKYYNEMWRDSEKLEGTAAEQMQAEARKIKPIERYYYNCVVRQQVNPKTQEVEKNVGPKILSIGKTLHQRIVRAIVGDKEHDEQPLGDVTDAKAGRDFKIIKSMRSSGKDAYPNYDSSKFLDPSPLGEKDQIDHWLETLHDLAGLRVLKTTDEMKVDLKKYLGIIKDDTTNFDMSEFQKKPDLAEQVRQSGSQNTPTPQTVVTAPASADEVLAEDEFMNELKNL